MPGFYPHLSGANSEDTQQRSHTFATSVTFEGGAQNPVGLALGLLCCMISEAATPILLARSRVGPSLVVTENNDLSI